MIWTSGGSLNQSVVSLQPAITSRDCVLVKRNTFVCDRLVSKRLDVFCGQWHLFNLLSHKENQLTAHLMSIKNPFDCLLVRKTLHQKWQIFAPESRAG